MTTSNETPAVADATEADPALALVELEQAAEKLFTGKRPTDEQRTVERLAFQLVMKVGRAFLQPPSDELAGSLRAALAALEADTGTVLERRVAAVRAIAQWAPAAQAADDRNRSWVLRQLVHALSLLDQAFAEVNTEGLADKLTTYRRDDGSAERILAEIICEDCDALGLASDPEKTEQEDVAELRAVLERDMRSMSESGLSLEP